MKQSGTILILDDEEDILFSLKMLLKPAFSRVIAVQNPQHPPRTSKEAAAKVKELTGTQMGG